MIHHETQKLLDYPDTYGKKAALSYYNWDSLDKVEECMVSPQIIEMARLIDKKMGEVNVITK